MVSGTHREQCGILVLLDNSEAVIHDRCDRYSYRSWLR